MKSRKVCYLPAHATRLAFISVLAVGNVHAEDIMDTTGFADYVAGSHDVQPLKDYGITWGGWVNAGVTANANSPADNFNGPMTFNDRAGELMMNQLYGYVQKAITVSGDSWDWGGRFDIMYGTDSIFTQAYGVPALNPTTGLPENRGNWDLHLTSFSDRFYALALPQAFLEFNLPFGNGIDLKVGHFYTPLGYEVVTAPDNFFYSHAYTMQYGEPFTHTGFLGSYAFDDNWTAMAGAVTGSATGGWDGNFNTQLSNWSFLGGATWTSDDKAYSLNLTSTAGAAASNVSDAWAIYSIVGKANFLNDDLHYVFQHDHGFADNVITGNGLQAYNNGMAGTPNQNAQWYGINQYLMYDIQDDLGVGIRAEWFRDANGFRVAGPGRCAGGYNLNKEGVGSSYTCSATNMAAYPFAGANYYALTAGLNYKPLKWVMLRPNVRYDWSSQNTFMGSNGTMLDNQFTFSADLVVTF